MITATIVIPSYNEAKRLPLYLEELCVIAENRPDTEIVVSDDGSRVEEYKTIASIVQSLQHKYPHAKLSINREEKNAGKGAAIAREFRKSSSHIVGFVDADGSVPASECFRIIDYHRHLLKTYAEAKDKSQPHCSAVIGTRIKMLGNPVDRHPYRHYSGRVFATMVSELFRIPIYDSQCGCKFFVREDVLKVMDFAYDQRWLWDTQIIISLFKAGFNQIEVPVSWHEVEGSKVSLVRDSWRMFRGLIRYRRYLRQVTNAGVFPPKRVPSAFLADQAGRGVKVS